MMKFRIIGAVALFSVLAGPALAQKLIVRDAHCGHHQLGNPYTQQEDYMAWSAWRARGSWAEPSYDPACARVIPSSHR